MPPALLTLTFDNGPTSGVTEMVLDELGARGLPATFFVVGQDLMQPGNRALAERAAAEGHWHGNHTLTHSVQLGLATDADVAQREIEQSQDVLGGLSHPDKLFRPWGDGRISQSILSPAAVDILTAREYTCVLWNCVPRDWDDPEGWPETALRAIDEQEWTVLVLHDQDTGALARLPAFLDDVARRDIEVVQRFPDSCVPIRNGRITTDIGHLIPDPSPSDAGLRVTQEKP